MGNETMKKPIIVFREKLLLFSEPFVKRHCDSLVRYSAALFGITYVPNTILSGNDFFVLNNSRSMIGWFLEKAYKAIGFAPTLVREIKKRRPLLIHVHFGTNAARLLPIVKKLRLPLVVTFHGTDATTTDEWKKSCKLPINKKYLNKRTELIQYTSRCIAISEFIKTKMLDQGIPERKIHVNYLGIDTSYFSPDPSITRDKTILFVGRMVEQKGGDHLINALALLKKRNQDYDVRFIGDGPQLRVWESLAKQKSLRASFTGIQTPQEVKCAMNRASIFCVPSLRIASGWSEGLGLVFAEAQAMGLPVVSYSTGGIPEVVSHGETGFLASPGNFHELAEYIQKLFNDKILYDTISKAAVARVRKMFDIRNCSAGLEKIYDEVLDTVGKLSTPSRGLRVF